MLDSLPHEVVSVLTMRGHICASKKWHFFGISKQRKREKKREKKWGEMRAERAERAGATGSFIHQLPFVVYSR